MCKLNIFRIVLIVCKTFLMKIKYINLKDSIWYVCVVYLSILITQKHLGELGIIDEIASPLT